MYISALYILIENEIVSFHFTTKYFSINRRFRFLATKLEIFGGDPQIYTLQHFKMKVKIHS